MPGIPAPTFLLANCLTWYPRKAVLVTSSAVAHDAAVMLRVRNHAAISIILALAAIWLLVRRRLRNPAALSFQILETTTTVLPAP